MGGDVVKSYSTNMAGESISYLYWESSSKRGKNEFLDHWRWGTKRCYGDCIPGNLREEEA